MSWNKRQAAPAADPAPYAAPQVSRPAVTWTTHHYHHHLLPTNNCHNNCLLLPTLNFIQLSLMFSDGI